MSISFEQRASDSPYIESITRGHTLTTDAPVRPAETSWHLVVVRQQGAARVVVVGPWTSAGHTFYTEGAELLWIKFRLGVWMPHLHTRRIRDSETVLPSMQRSFQLSGSTWEMPEYDNVETFVDRLARREMLMQDPVVDAVLHGHPQYYSPRTIRHRFLHVTGLTYSHIRQVERAQRAADLLQQGASIPDAMFETGYFDQPHLTRSLKQWIGHTPGQLARMRA